MSKYMRERFVYYGLSAPERVAIFKKYFNKKTFQNHEDCEFFCHLCLKMEQREWMYVIIEVLKNNQNNWDKNSIVFFEKVILHQTWWDSLDVLASSVIGPYFIKFPEMRDFWIEKWMSSENFWLNRVVLIFQLKYKSKTDYELLENAIVLYKESNEFFIQKAIGWALREISKHEPQRVYQIIENYELKPLSKREALRIVLKNKNI